MTKLVFFLEEPSAREMLKGIVPRILPPLIEVQYVVFEGKQDLEKRLPKRLRAWREADARFLVLRDQDSGDSYTIKASLAQKCVEAGHPGALVRIACHELESFYLGDLTAVAESIGPSNLAKLQSKKKFRTPDQLPNPSRELKQIAPAYQKVAGSRAIGPNMNIENNHSKSFQVLISGIQRICGEAA